MKNRGNKTESNGLRLNNGLTGDEKFLIVLACGGGASILDSFAALSSSEVASAGGNSSALNCFAEEQLTAVAGTPFRAVKVDTTISALGGFAVNVDQAPFLRKHYQDMMLVTCEGTSVNHGVAQKRSITGNDAWNGRTVQEAVAGQYGKGLPIPNLNLATGGFSVPGIDDALPEFARQVSVANPIYWPLGLHSALGLDVDADGEILKAIRDFRQQELERQSNWLQTFGKNTAVQRYVNNRDKRLAVFEGADLAQKLYWYPTQSDNLAPNPNAEALRDLFPNYERDNLDAQAILAYLAITEGVSCSVTLGPDPSSAAAEDEVLQFYNPPIAFDFSHTDHRGTQAMMWNRVLSVADRLIDLLKAKEFNPKTGESYWDRTMIYFATEFGRSRSRSADSEIFSSGHDLNNGSLFVSPLVNGNKFLGGVDPATGLTFGFDPATGAPAPTKKTTEKQLYSGILEALEIDTSGSKLPSMPAMKKA